MKEFIRELKARQPSSDDYYAYALMRIATFCDGLADKHQALVERVAELEGKVSDDDQDVRRLKNDVSDLDSNLESLKGDVRQLERGR